MALGQSSRSVTHMDAPAIETHDLERWEPVLACEVYAALLELCREETGPRRQALFSKLSRVDTQRAASL